MRLLISLFITLVSLAGCGTPSLSDNQVPEPMIEYLAEQQTSEFEAQLQSYVDSPGSYSIKYPNTWSITNSDMDIFDIFFIEYAADDSTIQSYITVGTAQTNASLNDFSRLALQSTQAQDGLSDFVLRSEQNIQVNGIPGIEHLMTYTMKERRFAQRAVVLKNSESIYTISLLIFEEQQASYIPIFDSVLRSFQLQ